MANVDSTDQDRQIQGISHRADQAAKAAQESSPEWLAKFDDADPLCVQTSRAEILEMASQAPHDFWAGYLWASYQARMQISQVTGRAFL